MNNKQLTERILIFVALYLFFGKPLLNMLAKFLGVKDSEEKIKVQSEALNDKSPFSTNFWHAYFYAGGAKPNGRKPITNDLVKRTNDLSIEIHKCFGILEDNEEGIVSAFAKFRSQCEVSLVATTFEQKYGKGFFDYLRTGVGVSPQNGLSETDLSKLILFVYKLPVA